MFLRKGDIVNLYTNGFQYKAKLKFITEKEEFVFEIFKLINSENFKEKGTLVCYIEKNNEKFFFYGEYLKITPNIIIVDRKSDFFTERRKNKRFKVELEGNIIDKKTLKVVKIFLNELSIDGGKLTTIYPLKINQEYEIEIKLPNDSVFSSIEIKSFQTINGKEFFGFVFLNINYENLKKVKKYIESLEEFKEKLTTEIIEKKEKIEKKENIKVKSYKTNFNNKTKTIFIKKRFFEFLNRPLPRFINLKNILIFVFLFYSLLFFICNFKIKKCKEEINFVKSIDFKKQVAEEKNKRKDEERKDKKEENKMERKEHILMNLVEKEKKDSSMREVLKNENINPENLEEVLVKYKFPIYYIDNEKFISLKTLTILFDLEQIKRRIFIVLMEK